MKVQLLVAAHKPYSFPDDPIYQPIQVGAARGDTNFGYLRDDTEQNISDKNDTFCELTALYWVWKNNYFNTYKYCGLVHYRRYFSGALSFGKFSILSADEITEILAEYDVIVPKKRNYYIESIRSHYEHAHYKKDLDILESLISDLSPEYNDAFKEVMSSTKLHLFNMFVMKTANFNRYMEWLFPILFALEHKIDISNYDEYQSRVFGFLSERLFNVWLTKNHMKTKALPIVNLEGENLPLKAFNMLKRKFAN